MDYEQTVNERLIDDARFSPIDHRSNTVRTELGPKRRAVWDQEVVWLPRASVRPYGPLEDDLRAAFGVEFRADRTPMILHPQAPPALRRLARSNGREVLTGGCHTDRVVRLGRGLAATWARRRRRAEAFARRQHRPQATGLAELYIAQSIVLSSVLATIPAADCKQLRLDWFTEPCGVVDVRSRHGWLLRQLPGFMTEPGMTTLMPVFSLISHHGDRVPLLVRLIRRALQRISSSTRSFDPT